MSEETPRTEGAEERPRLPVWKKVAFAAALLLGLVGFALTQAASGADAPGPGGAGVTPSGLGAQPSSLTTQEIGDILGGGGTAREAEADVSPWAPFFMKGGLSFAIAFAAGYALRTFLKMTLVVAGVVALAVFGLQKAGIVGEIDWAVAQGYWDSLTENVGRQFESFKTFLTGSLPSAGGGTVGLVAGFRR